MPLPALLRFLHAAPAEGVSDADLLRRFAAVRDEAAFELLVRRHADLVWKVCRGVLRQEADAEDAFQATFLALARKAGSVRGGCAAGWLHRVALHAALKLRAKASRTADLADVPAPAGPDPALAVAVHEELGRLGDRYRLPVLLCDLEGHTHAEAARVLGWPVGTVSGRLSRGRDRLRQRLERRGVALALVAITGSASGNLIRSAVSAAGGGASPAVVSLAEGVLSAMRTAKLKLMAAVSAAAVGLIGTGAIVAVGQERKPADTGKPDPAAKAEAGKPEPVWNEDGKTAFPNIKRIGPDEAKAFAEKHVPPVLESDSVLRKLQKAKLRAAMNELVGERQFLSMGDPKLPSELMIPSILQAAREAVATGVELSDRREDQHAWLEFGVGVYKEIEWYIRERAAQGIARPNSVLAAQRHRLDAEIALMKHAQQREAK
jgi:RNA polymerase sigma factor (sigma-70 family)